MKWLGHASFFFEHDGKAVYIDPFRLRGSPKKADVIFITHAHFDHLSPVDIAKISKPTTKMVVTKNGAEKIVHPHVMQVVPNQRYEIEGIKFSTVPAYNVVKERLGMHPKSNNWVGYLIETNGKVVYHAGDTDCIPEMSKITADLALLPMGGTYVMLVDETIEAAKSIRAAKFAPMHYRMLLGEKGSREAEQKFLKTVKNGVILEEEDPSYSF